MKSKSISYVNAAVLAFLAASLGGMAAATHHMTLRGERRGKRNPLRSARNRAWKKAFKGIACPHVSLTQFA